ncbi:7-cyano-7-deazaguanine synthase QueC [Aurantiacibacter aquimixticola]|uniref:7-cyano-7-deazaguanine synthase n=1 Tax=Aurantiacibacter aquimixticola TaxID=1958945 RepID=A0A419RV74_9SPHN|nr:7-cyano-7-deazaguanine synthase QueC [Aurantiacibacter aquimixticola]RJY09679.1 7-cyano-7-deazaguanine synthase QueC [Aurantiacibacter aquimixticola]
MAQRMSTEKSIATILLSGGLDSMVSAALAREQGFRLHALTIDYGQRHVRELQSAKAIAERMGVERHVELPLDLRQFGGSALTDDIEVPKDGVGEDIPVTYVPARNLLFLALTTAFAESSGSTDLFIGVNALDYSGYPDCRPEFIASFAETARLGTKQGVEGQPFVIHAPLQHMTKAEIASECARLELDPAWSWSCYDPTDEGMACGRCDSCRLRRKGFAEAGVTDTAPYAADPD